MADFSLQSSRSSFGSRLPLGGVLSLSAASIGLFAVVLAATGAIALLTQGRERQKTQFIEQNKIKEESLRPELLDQITSLDNRLTNARALLVNHPFVANVLRTLEADTHPQVRFSNFSFARDGLKAEMSGEAATYRVLARQIGIFEQDPQIQKVDFGGLSTTGEGLVGFKLTLVFRQSLVQLRPGGGADNAPAAVPASSGAAIILPLAPSRMPTNTPFAPGSGAAPPAGGAGLLPGAQ